MRRKRLGEGRSYGWRSRSWKRSYVCFAKWPVLNILVICLFSLQVVKMYAWYDNEMEPPCHTEPAREMVAKKFAHPIA